MDEVEFGRTMRNLKTLIQEVQDPSIRNPLLVIAAALNGLSEQITDMQLEEDDD